MGTRRTTAPLRSTTMDAYATTVDPGAVLPQPHKQPVNYGRKTEEAPRKKEGIKRDVYVMIPPKPFQHGPPLNGTAFLRLKSTKKKRRKDAVFVSLRGAPNRLVLSREESGKLMAHD